MPAPKKAPKAPPYKIIQDTREQQPFKFAVGKECEDVIVRKLDVADYSLEGYEDILLIERKLSVSEISGNLIGKDYERFERELTKLNEVPHAYLLLEFTANDVLQYPWGEKSLPLNVKRRIKITGKFILKRLVQIQMKFPNIRIVFAGTRAKEYALAIFSEITDA